MPKINVAHSLFRPYVVGVFVVSVFGLCAWSWVRVDPNFTFFAHANWSFFREHAIAIGYLNRPLATQLYIVLLTLLTTAHVFLVRFNASQRQFFALVFFIAFVTSFFSYPALSHDIFNYIFDARIFTHYGDNPYLMRAMDYPDDPMLRFMHWTHRTYPYGPLYLVLSYLPSFLGMGKFLPTFLLFKITHGLLYLLSCTLLRRIHKKSAVLFATSPLVLVEGLVNTHNDLVAVGLGIVGIYLLSTRRRVFGAIFLFISGLIKYLTLGLVISVAPYFRLQWRQHARLAQWGGFAATLVLIIYVSLQQEIQPWYFLNLFIFAPWFFSVLQSFWLFFAGLLYSYVPYVFGGEWGQGGDVGQKRVIIAGFLAANMFLIFTKILWSRIAAQRLSKKTRQET
jgi:hypothetical protein